MAERAFEISGDTLPAAPAQPIKQVVANTPIKCSKCQAIGTNNCGIAGCPLPILR